MLRAFKLLILEVLICAAVSTASAFSLYGPLTGEAWQVAQIGYQSGGTDLWGVDVASPRNFGEEYRWNTPVLYYSFDSSFVTYFGADGIAAIDQSFALFNALSNVDSYSEQLTEFPLDTSRYNLRAAGLGLIDLKSETIQIILEELGLGSSERWTWCLHDRLVGMGGCPNDVTYQVIKRNFDPVSFLPSSFVNGTLFTYFIVDICTGPPPIISDAYEYPVDPLSPSTGMAATSILQVSGGRYFTGLTRDDFGGLRYLWRTNNMNFEPVPADATLISTTTTNASTLQTLVTSNLTDLAVASLTNTPAQMTAMFPNLVISDFTSTFQLVVTSNTVAYFTNYPWSAAGSPASPVTAVVYTTNIQQVYTYSFANVVTNTYFTNGLVSTVVSNAAIPPFGSTVDPLVTNVTTQTKVANFINGDYFIVPTNTCNFEVLSNLLTLTTPVSTTVVAIDGTATNVGTQFYSVTTTTYLTNHVLLVRVTPCPAGAGGSNAVPALRQGMEKMTFVRKDYDSYLGQLYDPVTTNYNLYSVSGGKRYTETFRRTVTQPDFLITSADLSGDPGDNVITYSALGRSTVQFVQGPGTGAGPGIIDSANPVTFTYNNVGPIFDNTSPSSLDEATAAQYTWWGSFDGRTNEPIVYPNGTSLRNLENQVLIQITPNSASLPDGARNVFYFVQLGVTGGQPPYTWSLAPGSPGLPPGLFLSPSGQISGVPSQVDTFDIVVRLTDAGARTVDRPYSLTITP